jgi:hypothetical protein
MGGLVISQCAEQYGDKISRLVYVTGIIPRSGDTLLNAPAAEGLLKNMLLTPDGTSLVFQSQAAQEIFYADCSEEDLQFALEHLCPQPAAPGVVPLTLTPENFGRIPRCYIECLKDCALLPATQRLFYTEQPCEEVFSLDSSHSPFFSMPDELAQALIAISELP